MDFAAPKGTRINAVKTGKVTKVEKNEKNYCVNDYFLCVRIYFC